MKVTRLVAGPGADPADWGEWVRTVALTLGLPDPLPPGTRPIGIDGQPVEDDPSRFERATIIPLAAFPELLRPSGVDPRGRSVGLTMIIRRALYPHQSGVDGEGRPIVLMVDRGWECDICIYAGPGPGWDVDLLPDIITMSVQTGATLEWQAETRGTLELPCTPDGWARVEPLHPTVVYPAWEPPPVVVGPVAPHMPPGAP